MAVQIIPRITLSVGTATVWIPLDGRTTQSNFNGFHQCLWPVPGVFRNLRTKLTVAPGTSRTITLRVNGVDSALATVHGAADLTMADLTHTVTVAAGDVLDLALVGAGAATASIWWSLEFEPTAPGESGYTTNFGTGTTGYVNPFTGATNAARASVESPMPCAGRLTWAGACSTFNSVGAAQNLDHFIYLNGVKQDGTGGTVDTRVRLNNAGVRVVDSTAFSLPVARGDRIAVGLEVVTGYPSTWTTYGLRFVADDGVSILAGRGSNNPSNSSENYSGPGHFENIWATDQDVTRLVGGITPFTLRDLYLYADTDPAPGTRRFRIRHQGTFPAGGPDGILSAGVLTIDDDGSIDVAEGDTFQMAHTPAGTPVVTGVEFWAMVIDTLVEEQRFNPDQVGPIGLIWAEAYLPT